MVAYLARRVEVVGVDVKQLVLHITCTAFKHRHGNIAQVDVALDGLAILIVFADEVMLSVIQVVSCKVAAIGFFNQFAHTVVLVLRERAAAAGHLFQPSAGVVAVSVLAVSRGVASASSSEAVVLKAKWMAFEFQVKLSASNTQKYALEGAWILGCRAEGIRYKLSGCKEDSLGRKSGYFL